MRVLLGLLIGILILGSPDALAGREAHGETTPAEEATRKQEITLDIELTGLITLVREGCKMGNTTAIHAIMMRDPDMEHAPRLIVDAQDAAAPNNPSEILAVPNGKQYLVWDLSGYRIELPDPPPAIRINESPLGERQPKDREDSENFSWVATLDQSCKAKPTDQDVDKGAVRPQELPDYASARLMRIPVTAAADAKGVLKARFDAEDGDLPSEDLFEFTPYYIQALADGASIVLDLKVASPWVLKLVPFEKHRETIEVRLKQQPEVTLTLSNLPMHQMTYNAEKDRLNHFKRFHKMLPEGQRANCMAPIRKPESAAAPVKCTLCGSCGPHP